MNAISMHALNDETALAEMSEQLWDEAHAEHGDALFAMIERDEVTGATMRERAISIMSGGAAS